jgi:hypothetical protein
MNVLVLVSESVQFFLIALYAVLLGWWWPVGPKLVLDQMAEVVMEITDGSLYLWLEEKGLRTKCSAVLSVCPGVCVGRLDTPVLNILWHSYEYYSELTLDVIPSVS